MKNLFLTLALGLATLFASAQNFMVVTNYNAPEDGAEWEMSSLTDNMGIGYSINDTVVVFDRIREYSILHKKSSAVQVVDKALNSTLSRTINTSLSTFLVLLTIFIFGGESIKGFAFALMVGVVIGTYSSLFIATPLVVDLSKNKINS